MSHRCPETSARAAESTTSPSLVSQRRSVSYSHKNHVLHPLEVELSTLEDKNQRKNHKPLPKKKVGSMMKLPEQLAFLGDSRIRRMEGYANDTMIVEELFIS